LAFKHEGKASSDAFSKSNCGGMCVGLLFVFLLQMKMVKDCQVKKQVQSHTGVGLGRGRSHRWSLCRLLPLLIFGHFVLLSVWCQWKHWEDEGITEIKCHMEKKRLQGWKRK
jgi:hypothetical protein